MEKKIDKSKKNNKPTYSDRIIYVGSLGFTLIVFLIIGAIIIIDKDTLIVEEETTSEDTQEVIDPLTLSLPDQITPIDLVATDSFTVNEKAIRFPEPYSLNTAYVANDVEYFSCGPETERLTCTLYEVLNKETGQTYFFSSPKEIMFKTLITSTETDLLLTVAGTPTPFIGRKMGLFNEQAAESPVERYSEIYGCLTETICVNSGVLPIDETANRDSIGAFTRFLEQISIE